MKKSIALLLCLLVASLSLLVAAPRLTQYDNADTVYPDRADSLTGFDVTKYEITLTVNDVTHNISGNVIAHVTSESNLTAIEYNLLGLTVSEVRVNNVISTFTHTNGIIHIPVNFTNGQSFTTTVTYSGVPALSSNVYHIGMIFSTNMVFTLSDPDACRQWWPCYDHPWDKALVDLHITMRSDWLVAANGIRESIVDNGNGTKTHNWLGSNPMVPYLACFTAGPYVEINQTAGDVPIQNFVFQSQYNNALIDFATLPEILQFYETQFGTYPFEKYGNAVVNMTTYGAMEHQTQTTMGAQYITGNHSGEFTIAHELAHQWYGDAVSPLTFKDVWLSEGFATYAEALWSANRDGWAAGCNYVDSQFHQYYMSYENGSGAQTIYNPSFNNYFTPPEYEKAASVLHMLRLKMGDTDFFELLHNWFTTYRDGNAITSEFQTMAEQISGLDLNQFFNQWIYGSGIPSVEYTMLQDLIHQQGKIVGKTISPTTTQFNVDIPFVAYCTVNGDSETFVASPQGQSNQYTMHPDCVEFYIDSMDANHWVLNRGIVHKDVLLSQCIGSNNSVFLNWESFSNIPTLTEYRIFRRTFSQNAFTYIDNVPPNINSFLDNTAENGVQYFYQIRAVDDASFETLGSNEMSATPVEFSFDSGLLVVDETRDGNGGAITPTDAMVDEFYAAALSPFDYTSWDYATQNVPTLNTLSHYPLVLWHADDFTQNQLLDNLDLIGSYLIGGGKLILSGWKTPSVFNISFSQTFLPNTTLVYDNGAVLVSAVSDDYPTLLPDPAKLSAVWNGMVPMVYTFDNATYPLYHADMIDTAAGDGLPVAARYYYNGELVIFGIPLYCMQLEGVRGLLQQLVPELYPDVANQDETVPAVDVAFECYPNPSRGNLNISFYSKVNDRPVISIYNIKGQKVQSVYPDITKSGRQSIIWNGSDQTGKPLSNGIYLISLQAGNQTTTQKVILIK